LRAERKEKYEKKMAAHREDQQRYIQEMAVKAQQDFDESFTWDEWRLIAARAYWSSVAAHVEAHGTHIGALAQSELAAEAAAGVKSRCVQRWMYDYEANGGQFSESLWGKNTKTPSLLGDIETRQWIRDYIIKLMGHKKGKKNLVAMDFSKDLHAHLGLPWGEEPMDQSIKSTAIYSALHAAGGQYMEIKQGSTFHDNHGAEDVVNRQRPRFLQMYEMFYACGPNYVFKDGHMVDKDTVENLHDSGLLDAAGCIGPRGIRLGGMKRPGPRPNLPFNVNDHAQKVWIIMCQDECCVHTLKEERMAWVIPGLEMGDMPTKSDGDICHLSEADAEFGCGCLSLVGKPGWITRKDLIGYISAKRAGENPPLPHFSTVYMHAGKGHEGSWEGDDANMHFELMMDQFDILFNLEHKVI
jgi:hypothetical protein